jgi:hypothetical protein
MTRETCPRCDGDGDGPTWDQANCPQCGGSGKIEAALADPPVPSGPGIELIADERRRQISVEGWAPEHDDRHDLGELVTAAICYAVAGSALTRNQPIPDIIATRWPWERAWWKPSDDPIRNLVKAGALIAAEIDRLCRGATR